MTNFINITFQNLIQRTHRPTQQNCFIQNSYKHISSPPKIFNEKCFFSKLVLKSTQNILLVAQNLQKLKNKFTNLPIWGDIIFQQQIFLFCEKKHCSIYENILYSGKIFFNILNIFFENYTPARTLRAVFFNVRK